MCDGNFEWLKGQTDAEFLPPFRPKVMISRGEMEVHRVDGFSEKRHQHVWPDPQRTLAIHMTRREHKSRAMLENLPREPKLIANRLHRLAELSRKSGCHIGRGALEHAGDRRVSRDP